MNKIYRVIWNSALRCFMVASELATGKTKSESGSPARSEHRKIFAVSAVTTAILATFSGAAMASSAPTNKQLLVDGIQASYDQYLIATRETGEAGYGILAQNAGADLTFSNAQVTTTGAGAGATMVRDGANLNFSNGLMASLAPNSTVFSVINGSTATATDLNVWGNGAGSTGIYASGNSQITGKNVAVQSVAIGVHANNAQMSFDTLNVSTSGVNAWGIYSLGADSKINMTDATVNTTGSGSVGLYATAGGQITGNNVNVTTTAASARGINATGGNTRIVIDGGSVSTAGSSAFGVYASTSASVQVSNMDITTTAPLQAQAGGAAGLYAVRGGYIKADNLTLISRGNAISLNAATIDGNNLHIIQNYSDYGPAIWGLANSTLNLKNSEITLAGSGAQGIYTDAGSANLDGVSIHGDNGSAGLVVRYDGQLNAKNIDIAINNARGEEVAGLYMARGSGKTQATIEDSRIVINGSNAAAVISGLAGQHATVKNTLVASDNIAVNVYNGASLTLTASGSTLTAPTLVSAGTVNTAGAKAGNVYLDASEGSRLTGNVALERDYVSDSRLSLDTGSVWQGASAGLKTLNLSNNSQWTMTGDSNVGVLNLADSTVVFNHDSDSFNTLTVDGDYTSNGGTLVMNSVLAGDGSAHDSLKVTGDTSGETDVVINKAGGSGAQTLQGIEVITVGGESRGDFTQQGRIVAGAYDYHLMRGTDSNAKNWYLVSDVSPVDPVNPIDPVSPPDPVAPVDPEIPVDPVAPVIRPVIPAKPVMITRPEAGSYLANMAAASTMFNLRLHDRGGETQYTDAITGEKKTTSLWMRNTGGHTTSTDSSGQLDTQTNRYVVQLGGDLGKWSFDGSDSLHIGALAGYGNAQSNTDSKVTGYRSKGQVNGYSLGVYGTWYQNAEAQTGAYVDSWAQYSWFNNSVKGDDLPQESYKSKGVSASLESGYSWKLGEDSRKNSYFIEPNAQVIWSNIQADSLTESNGTRVSTQGNGDVQSRIGVRAAMKTHSENKQPVFQPYLEANWINNSQNAGSTMNGVDIEQRGSKNIAELRAGIDGQLTQRVNLWGNVGQQMGSEKYRDTSAMLGVKVSF